ncbi:Transposase [Garciella nitratireducens DSM 15102]|uniref:Transposase n=1 Tax=Garciella nitratireducens DSM 15102 TaxID=1121911 RepID=A0A1T4PYA8_9FIRM|nr:Transposase [Garciella nitratireducens DSM 15102]SJZ95948.1 Transposase [Garciella nitratireducens DSM 15102]
MISDLDRVVAVELINEARANGARLKPACRELNISERTYQRWTKEGTIKKDQRPLTKRPTPKNKLLKKERLEVIKIVNSPKYTDLVPSQIVFKLADEMKGNI